MAKKSNNNIGLIGGGIAIAAAFYYVSQSQNKPQAQIPQNESFDDMDFSQPVQTKVQAPKPKKVVSRGNAPAFAPSAPTPSAPKKKPTKKQAKAAAKAKKKKAQKAKKAARRSPEARARRTQKASMALDFVSNIANSVAQASGNFSK